MIIVFIAMSLFLGTKILLKEKKYNYGDYEVENTEDTRITERFYYSKTEKTEYYEVVYDNSKKKSYLFKAKDKGEALLAVKSYNSDKVWDENLYEGIGVINTEHIEEVRIFDFQRVAMDETIYKQKINKQDIVYDLSIEEIYKIYQWLSNQGKVIYFYETPKYFQCYIENEKKEIVRMLVIYGQKDSDATLIYGVVRKNKKNISSEFLLERLINE